MRILLLALLTGCATPPDAPERVASPASAIPAPARAIPVAPVRFRTLDRATERAIEPPSPELFPLVVHKTL